MVKSLKIQYVALALLSLASLLFAELKIGYINSERILAEYQGTKDASEKFQKQVARWEQEASDRQKKIQEMQEQLEKQSLLLSAERKKEIESTIEKESIELRNFVAKINGQEGDMAKKYAELVKPIVEKINKILDKMAKDENYDFIMDTRGGLVYGKKAYDLTEKVLQILNSEK